MTMRKKKKKTLNLTNFKITAVSIITIIIENQF